MLEPLPELATRRIVVATTVRKSKPILEAYLTSLDWQELPPRTEILYCFVADFGKPNTEAEQYLREWVKARNGVVLNAGPTATADFTDLHPVTHQWTENAMHRVGRNKNRIIKYAMEQKADAVFFADADLIMDRTTLWSLLHIRNPVTCAVYWTKWQRSPTPELTVHAGPQVWLQHPYILSGRGYEEGEFRRKLITRQAIQVWGQGACSLIQRKVFEAGIDFSPQPEVPQQGLMAGEDRQFCIACERKHIPMAADAWPDIYHIYHLPDDEAHIPAMLERLGQQHPNQPSSGDLVSLTLEALEGVPQPTGPQAIIGPQFIRGRLGALPLLPELEDAILSMSRGTDRIVSVHYPIHHPVAQLRGSKRLIRATLVDCKPYGFAPVIEEELYFGRGGAWHDATQLTDRQHESILATT